MELKKTRPNILVIGDYNIAHEEIDIHAPKRNENNSGFLRPERDWMTKWFAETGLVDTFRALHPEKVAYSWWSYRAPDWDTAYKGRRLDHVWATPDIANSAHSSRVIRSVRGWEQPSDHAPVFATFDL